MEPCWPIARVVSLLFMVMFALWAISSPDRRRRHGELLSMPRYSVLDGVAIGVGIGMAEGIVGSYSDSFAPAWIGVMLAFELPIVALGAWLEARCWVAIPRSLFESMSRLARAAAGGS